MYQALPVTRIFIAILIRAHSLYVFLNSFSLLPTSVLILQPERGLHGQDEDIARRVQVDHVCARVGAQVIQLLPLLLWRTLENFDKGIPAAARDPAIKTPDTVCPVIGLY